jgi:long-chain acyl-CoA synthetase
MGIPDAYRAETVKAFVVFVPGETAADTLIIDFCRERLTRCKVPTAVEFRDSLPKSAVRKLLRGSSELSFPARHICQTTRTFLLWLDIG